VCLDAAQLKSAAQDSLSVLQERWSNLQSLDRLTELQAMVDQQVLAVDQLLLLLQLLLLPAAAALRSSATEPAVDLCTAQAGHLQIDGLMPVLEGFPARRITEANRIVSRQALEDASS
jgi:hypothetical protein